jgi:mono/diheme cytochrome c family protein
LRSYPCARIRLLVALVLLTTVLGCAGAGPDVGSDASGGLAAIQRDIFNPSCISGSCHNPISRAGDLSLVEADAYHDLLQQPTNNAVAQQAGLRRVQPFEPDNSFLVIKCVTPAPGEGSRMPLTGPQLSAAQVEQIRVWIRTGAPQFESASPTPTLTPTEAHTATATASPTQTATPLPSNTATLTPTGTLPATPTATSTPTVTTTPSSSPTPTATATPTFNADATFANIQTRIFNTTCIDEFCHTAEFQAGDLSLVEGQSYAQLVNVPAANVAAQIAQLLRVKPGDAPDSFLLIKVTHPSPPQGSLMPLGKPPLTTDQIELIRAWIVQGALP